MKVFEAFGKKLVNGDVGIEIEVEGTRLPTQDNLTMWRVERDGSLRGNSSEYVLKGPMTIGRARAALNELDYVYNIKRTDVYDSVRAGVHVHINVQGLTIKQLFNYVVAYILLEETLVSWCGPSRKGNLFCLRTIDADYIVPFIKAALQNKRFNMFNDDEIRYCSINLKALTNYGSLEFRAMHGTRDLSRVLCWTETLLNIREVSKEYANPVQIVEEFFNNPYKVARELIGPNTTLFLQGEINLRGTPRIANDIAHAINWDSLSCKNIGGLYFPDDIDFPQEPLEDF